MFSVRWGASVANTGFQGQYSAVCLPVDEYVKAYCSATTGGYSQYAGTTFWAAGGYEVWCYTPGVQTSRYLRIGYPNCAVSGPPLTDNQQIEAVSALLPYALGFLAAVWGLRRVFDVLWSSALNFRSKSSDTE